MQTNFLIGREAFEHAACTPPKRIRHFIQDGDKVTIPSINEVCCWFFGQPWPNAREQFWVQARVVRPSTGQNFSVPVFISMMNNEIQDVDGDWFANTVEGIDLNNANSLLDQAKMIAGLTYIVNITRIVVEESHPMKHHRERPVYTWHPC